MHRMMLYLANDIKTIQLTQQLHQGTLNLPVCTGALAEPSPSNGINFVHEDDARLVFLCIAKHLSDQPRTLPNVLVHNGT